VDFFWAAKIRCLLIDFDFHDVCVRTFQHAPLTAGAAAQEETAKESGERKSRENEDVFHSWPLVPLTKRVSFIVFAPSAV